MLKKILACMLALFVLASLAEGAQRTRGYMKKNGTYVMPHYKTRKDGTRLNNYSTKGNVNPYTGKKGYKDPFKVRRRGF